MNDDDRLRNTGRGCFIIMIIILAALLYSLSGCRTTRTITETVTRSDTVTVKRDSIIIHERIDTVEIPVPVSSQTVEIPIEHDTVSILSDKYYTSVAAVFDGRLRHSLNSNPGATLAGAAVVHDTVKVYVDSTMINNNTSHSEVKEVTVNKPPWYKRVLYAVGVGLLVLFLVAFRKPIYALIKRI